MTGPHCVIIIIIIIITITQPWILLGIPLLIIFLEQNNLSNLSHATYSY